jgi:hypothetical protein
MQIDEILSQWKEDSKIDRLELGNGSLRTQELHAKYIDIFFHERAMLLRLKDKHNKLKRLRYEYWMGYLPTEDLKENGWPPQPLKIIKADIDLYMDGDEVLSDANMRLLLQQEKVNVLQEIIKSINQRGYHIKNAVDWERFKSGV